MSSRTKIALHGTVVNIAQYAILVALQVFVTPLILKNLGQETLGAYSIVMQIVGYSMLLDLGFSVALGRFLSQAFGQPDRKMQFYDIFRIGTLVFLVTNLAAAIVLVGTAYWADKLVAATEGTADQIRISLYVYAIWLVVRSPLQIYGAGLIASQNLVAVHLIVLAGTIARFFGMIVAALIGAGLTSLVFSAIGAELLTFLLQKRHFSNTLFSVTSGLNDWLQIKVRLLSQMMFFGLQYFGVRLAQVLTAGSDALLVGYLFNASQAAVFYTTKMPAFLLVQFIFKLADNTAPAINELLGCGEVEKVKLIYYRILRYTLMLAFPLAIGIAALNFTIISIWVGPGQFAGQIMSAALSGYVITQAIAHVDAMIVVASGRMQYWTSLSVFLGLTYLAAAFLLGAYLGMEWIMVALFLVDIPGLAFLHHRSSVVLGFTSLDSWRASVLPALRASVPIAIVALIPSAIRLQSDFLQVAFFGLLFLMTWLVSSYMLALLPNERVALRQRLASLVQSCGL